MDNLQSSDMKKQFADYDRETQELYQIKDASLELYEAAKELEKAFSSDGGYCFNEAERKAWDLMIKALLRAEGK